MRTYKLLGVISVSLLTSSVYAVDANATFTDPSTTPVTVTATSIAKTRWIAGVNLGGAIAQPGKSETLVTQPGKSNNYVNNTSLQTKLLAGAFVGLDFPVSPKLNYQLTLAYNQILPYSVNGQLEQFSDKSFTNFNYDYKIQSQQLFLDSKLVLNATHRIHPYALIGLGTAFNKASAFTATSIDGTDVNPGIFADHSTTNFAYTLGLGVDVDVSKHVRVGGGYRFANLGKTNLGAAPDFVTKQGLSTNLMTHEILATVSYIF